MTLHHTTSLASGARDAGAELGGAVIGDFASTVGHETVHPGDICRTDLLVEIESQAIHPAPPT